MIEIEKPSKMGLNMNFYSEEEKQLQNQTIPNMDSYMKEIKSI